MKVFIITESDLSNLILAIDRNPQHGEKGGSSRGTPSREQLAVEQEAHSFFNFQVRRWIKEISSGERTFKGV